MLISLFDNLRYYILLVEPSVFNKTVPHWDRNYSETRDYQPSTPHVKIMKSLRDLALQKTLKTPWKIFENNINLEDSWGYRLFRKIKVSHTYYFYFDSFDNFIDNITANWTNLQKSMFINKSVIEIAFASNKCNIQMGSRLWRSSNKIIYGK